MIYFKQPIPSNQSCLWMFVVLISDFSDWEYSQNTTHVWGLEICSFKWPDMRMRYGRLSP